ncbi:predicted protein [Streptomyces viridosporus ATCC 14672]|uniref:Predicted protein n=1 Tax=Streptomyces viridosporus (strain ATCC 14672 / DSM 40746 / JCM 4963 / KCTC 9882 / NRRL B-12104 / FH 1290) TaxID=566461 RepID=D6AA45_STRV1|nr:predicted protein [Streptomyces viridosporus ATCC 14672]EFE72146.1 predicted protein [Streptomyces viridosporus ATCC 14672]
MSKPSSACIWPAQTEDGKPSLHRIVFSDGAAKNYRYSTKHQVVIDADTRRVVADGRPVTGNCNDGKAWEISGAKDAVGHTTVLVSGAPPSLRTGTGRTEVPCGPSPCPAQGPTGGGGSSSGKITRRRSSEGFGRKG